jgi:hypothetical protein
MLAACLNHSRLAPRGESDLFLHLILRHIDAWLILLVAPGAGKRRPASSPKFGIQIPTGDMRAAVEPAQAGFGCQRSG